MTTVEIAAIIPSRGRPEQAARLVDMLLADRTTRLVPVLSLDDDDDTLPEYGTALEAVIQRHQPDPPFELCARPEPGISGHLAPFLTMVGANPQGSSHAIAINWGVALALRDLKPEAIIKLDDDHMPRTDGWDRKMLNALREMGTGIVYGDDKFQGPNLPTAPMFTTNIPRALGYLCPPEIKHLYVDNVWRDWGTRTDRYRYLPDVVIEHCTPQAAAHAGTVPWDATYERGNSNTRWQEDHAAYERYRCNQLDRDIRKIKELL